MMAAYDRDLAGSASDLLEVAREAFVHNELEKAAKIVSAASACARAGNAPALEEQAQKLLVVIEYEREDLSAAILRYRQLADARTKAGRLLDAAQARASLAFVLFDLGDTLEAVKELDAIEHVAAVSGSPRLIAQVADYRGNICRQAGALQSAREFYVRAIKSASDANPLSAAVPRMDLAATMLLEGRMESARKLLAEARDAAAEAEDLIRAARLSRIVAHYATLAAMLAGQTVAERQIEEGMRALRPVRVWLADATARGRRTLKADRELLDRLAHIEESAATEHARISVRILRNHLGPSRDDGLLVSVDADGSAIERGARHVDLSKRAALRSLLARLAWSRVHAPATPVPLDSLIAAGWPDERIQLKSARNRVHVALSSLRQFGLEGALIYESGGYHLDPRRTVIRPSHHAHPTIKSSGIAL